MDSIISHIFSFTGLFALLSVLCLFTVFIFIKQKKYWHLPGSILLVITFALFVKDRITGSDIGHYALAGVLFISMIESVVELRKLSKTEMGTEEENRTKKSTMFWGMVWLFMKGFLIYFLLTA